MKIHNKASLRDIKMNDLNMILEWRNQEFIRDVMFQSDFITYKQHIEWFKGMQSSQTAISKLFYFDEIPYGVLNITEIDKVNNTCKWGFYVGSQTAPKGIGSILGYMSLYYIFDELNIRKLSAEVLDYNQRSIYFHEKMGFTQEGILREQIIKKGEYRSILQFGYLKSEWKDTSIKLRESIERRFK